LCARLGTGDNGVAIFGLKTFKKVEVNTDWMNPGLYVLFTLPLYIAWVALQIELLPSCFPSRTFDHGALLASYASVGALFAALPGILNLLVFSTSGMEGNVMGFLFALPLLIAIGFYFGMWVHAVLASY
jgi:hypothetical protein